MTGSTIASGKRWDHVIYSGHAVWVRADLVHRRSDQRGRARNGYGATEHLPREAIFGNQRCPALRPLASFAREAISGPLIAVAVDGVMRRADDCVGATIVRLAEADGGAECIGRSAVVGGQGAALLRPRISVPDEDVGRALERSVSDFVLGSAHQDRVSRNRYRDAEVIARRSVVRSQRGLPLPGFGSLDEQIGGAAFRLRVDFMPRRTDDRGRPRYGDRVAKEVILGAVVRAERAHCVKTGRCTRRDIVAIGAAEHRTARDQESNGTH